MKKIMMIGLLFILAMSLPDTGNGCGPTVPNTIFSYTYHPDFPLENFLNGKLGVLRPEYANSYLYVAYRNLIGTGFTEKEQHEILKRWNRFWGTSSEIENVPNEPREIIDADWIRARKNVPNAPEIRFIRKSRSEQKGGQYVWYLNCNDHAFATAVKTLRERISQFGASSNEVTEWLRGQDIVFSNCSEGSNASSTKNIPPLVGGGMHPLISADRSYQIASAYFYSSDFETAEKMFRAIANEQSSPWDKISRYLVARSLIRKASLDAGPGKNDQKLLAQAKAELTQILVDPYLKEIHDAAEDMLNLVESRLAPEKRLKGLADALLKKDNADNLYSDLADYMYLLDQFPAKPDDDLTDWLMHIGKKDTEYSLKKWNETRSLPWLVAALSAMKPDQPEAASLIEDAQKIEPSSPAYPMVAYHNIRLFIESGNREAARKKLDLILSELKNTIPQSSLNLFLEERMSIAQNMAEFLVFAQRVPVGIFYDEIGREMPYDGQEFDSELMKFKGMPLFDKDSGYILNELLPISLLMDISRSDALPEHLRREIAIAACVRAILLDDYKTARELSPIMLKYFPQENKHLMNYEVVKKESERKFVAAYILLKYPGMRPYIAKGVGKLTPLNKIDNYRENWWCSLKPGVDFSAPNRIKGYLYSQMQKKPDTDNSSESRNTSNKSKRDGWPEFLTSGQIETAMHEKSMLSQVPTAPNYLTKIINDWAKLHPKDPRVPEALYLAVRSTRYGCEDTETSKYSKQAFQLLHKKYPDSEWTKKTPYWF